jgi:hypothetical protein
MSNMGSSTTTDWFSSLTVPIAACQPQREVNWVLDDVIAVSQQCLQLPPRSRRLLLTAQSHLSCPGTLHVLSGTPKTQSSWGFKHTTFTALLQAWREADSQQWRPCNWQQLDLELSAALRRSRETQGWQVLLRAPVVHLQQLWHLRLQVCAEWHMQHCAVLVAPCWVWTD